MPKLILSSFLLLAALACGGSDTPVPTGTTPPTGGTTPPTGGTTTPPVTTSGLAVLGRGNFSPSRRTAELAVRGSIAYTTTWGNPASPSIFYIWDVSANVPILLDSVAVASATTLGDIAISDDGTLLVVATERAPGAILIYSLADPRKPALITRYNTPETNPG
ncbi:MAG: hypothetical protein H0W68_10475, partial [Gemmatimonadaceae bacterium]|nr:hypothetical protein [Gemmatimonadaceae bacterium]